VNSDHFCFTCKRIILWSIKTY